MKKKVTMRDIAERANVALSTVSHVLNNKSNVSPEMREHVLSVTEELGYVVHGADDSPALSTIGLLTRSKEGETPLLQNPFYAKIISSVERECQQNDISFMFANIEVDERNHAKTLPPMLIDEVVDGFLILGTFLEETMLNIRDRVRQNIVLIDSYVSNHVALDSVLTNNFQGAFAATSFLIEHGHCRIGLLGSNPRSYPSICERRDGYLAALEEHNLQPYVIDSGLKAADGREATEALLDQYPDVTAVFVCNDSLAISVMNVMFHMGLRVPDDISIIGFDDIDTAEHSMPPLTTMCIDKTLMGITAVRHLQDRFLKPDRPALKTLISVQLVERESVQHIKN